MESQQPHAVKNYPTSPRGEKCAPPQNTYDALPRKVGQGLSRLDHFLKGPLELRPEERMLWPLGTVLESTLGRP